MRYLLDTHTFIWWDSNASKLSSTVFNLLKNPENTFWFSIASVWEMPIKYQAGKLTLRMPLPELIQHQQNTNQIELLPILLPHVLALDSLPLHHKDPFDRILVAQGQVEKLTLVSHDPIFTQYGISMTW